MIKSYWDKLSAERYDCYSEKYPLYKETSQFLVELADIKKEMIVVDLACGTGTMIKEILKRLRKSGRVIGIDSSKEMIEVAKEKFKQKNVSFVHSPAEKINKAIKEKVDLVLCNSAFWQMDTNKTLNGIKEILKDNGNFIFNIPVTDQFYKFPKKSKKLRDTLLYLVMEDIAVKEYNIKLKDIGRTILWDFEKVNKVLKDNSFKIDSLKILKMIRTIKDHYEFFKIPVMTATRFPGVSYSKRMEILDKAYKQANKSCEFINKWVYFITKKSNI